MRREQFEELAKRYGIEIAQDELERSNELALGRALGFSLEEDFFGNPSVWHTPSHEISYLRELVERGAVLDVDCGGFIGHNYVHDIDRENFSLLETFFTAYDAAIKEDEEDNLGVLHVSIRTLPVFQGLY